MPSRGHRPAAAAFAWLALCLAGAGASGQLTPQQPAPEQPVDATAPQADAEPKKASGDDHTVAVNEHGGIQMHVSGMSLSGVLRWLAIESKQNIIASPGVTGKVDANLYNVTLDEALDAILRPNDAGFIRRGNFIYVYTNKELDELLVAQPEGRVYHLNYIRATEAEAIVKPLLGTNGTISRSPDPEIGIASAAEQAGGQDWAGPDYLYVFDRPDVHQRVAETLAKIDVRPRQVLVEATILRASLTDDNALGVDFTLVGGVDLELLGSTSNAITDITVGQLPTDRFELFNSNASTDFIGDLPPGGITLGIIKDHVAVFLKALEQVTDTSVIANPKVLALNRQKGQVIVGRRDGYLTTTFTETTAQQTIEFLETGTQLIFRPFIGNDGYVRVELHPEDSTGGVDSQGLPFEQTTEVTTNVIVRDGHTILIGGLFRELATDTRSQVPALGDIPGLGMFFQSRQDNSTREEVIILLTVHVVKDDENYARMSVELDEEIEKMRVGLRAGMMWHGRERLAQAHYRRALEHYADGDIDKALWNLNMALGNYPRFLAAIDLKESIVGQRQWEEEGTAGRHFIRTLIGRENAEWVPDYERQWPLAPAPQGAEPAPEPAAPPADDPTDPTDIE